MPCSPHFFQNSSSEANDGLIISGLVHVTNKSSSSSTVDSIAQNRLPKVILAVYRTCTEHFAVIYPSRLSACARKPMATINLKSYRVTVSADDDNLIIIRARKDVDGASLMIRPISMGLKSVTEEWIKALDISSCYRYPYESELYSPKAISPLPLIVEEVCEE